MIYITCVTALKRKRVACYTTAVNQLMTLAACDCVGQRHLARSFILNVETCKKNIFLVLPVGNSGGEASVATGIALSHLLERTVRTAPALLEHAPLRVLAKVTFLKIKPAYGRIIPSSFLRYLAAIVPAGVCRESTLQGLLLARRKKRYTAAVHTDV